MDKGTYGALFAEGKKSIHGEGQRMENKKIDLAVLSNELITRRYLFNKNEIHKVISRQDYIALHIIVDMGEHEAIYGGKAYLKDIAEKMQLSIRQTSKLAGSLRDRGLVTWSHDGDGSGGTYVTLTEEGKQLLSQQKEILEEFYGRVIEKFGTQNLLQLLRLMKQLETVMSSEMEEMEAGADDLEGQ